MSLGNTAAPRALLLAVPACPLAAGSALAQSSTSRSSFPGEGSSAYVGVRMSY
ncbi:hypothetical protein [uncultured Brevundimonas sp.]|uniref:hypothetical protein n=1 Tax=uncultured Brevundimonas sp. TaxID=213418 RepID=UPI0026282749|nr:hypothetical protein [uncultured Brevundimonas sp.]